MDGTPFGRYRLIEKLGEGGMGEVWRAFDSQMNRVVALKVLPAHFANDRTFQQRFRREAESAAGLEEPHVVPIYDFGEIDGRLYITMRLIKGHDLLTLLQSGPVKPRRAVKIIEQIASALHAAHEIGLVHRDVKPSNILVAQEDFAYLIDFGIARAAGQTGLTSTGTAIGTWAYMAPERLNTGTAEASADIYALTCVLYEALTGKRPFPGDSLEQQIVGHLTMPPPRPSKSEAAVPASMDKVIAKGMAKSPDDRYATTRELAENARIALSKPAGSPDDASTPKKSPPREPPRTSARSSTRTSGGTRGPRGSSSEAPTVKAASVAAQSRVGWAVSRRQLAAVAVAIAVVAVLVWRPWQDGSSVNRSAGSNQPGASATSAPASVAPTPTPISRPTEERTTIETTTSVVGGSLASGYREVYNSPERRLASCGEPSPAAVTPNVYLCTPYAEGANICWAAPPMSMLCLDDPWSRSLRRYTYSTAQLPQVFPGNSPKPYALLLDDGTRCRLLTGGTRWVRPDGYHEAYSCGITSGSNLSVMAADNDNPTNRSSPLWTVVVGVKDSALQTHSVTTAWFAAAEGDG